MSIPKLNTIINTSVTELVAGSEYDFTPNDGSINLGERSITSIEYRSGTLTVELDGLIDDRPDDLRITIFELSGNQRYNMSATGNSYELDIASFGSWLDTTGATVITFKYEVSTEDQYGYVYIANFQNSLDFQTYLNSSYLGWVS